MRYIRYVIVTLALLAGPLYAWDYSGHRIVAAVAMASLPEDFPVFARSAAATERTQFLSGEPDRWRNLPDPTFRHSNEPDHYCDIEEMSLYGFTPETLPEFRYELVGKIYLDRAVHPETFAGEVPYGEDVAKIFNLFGLLPYSINENFLKLKSGFKALHELEINGGDPADIAQLQQNIIYVMGVMSHYVGDGSQPLHTTKHHHGWVGDNPNNYTTNRRIHSWIDGGFIASAGITSESLLNRVQPAHLIWPADTADITNAPAFRVIMKYLDNTYAQVEPLYQLYKEKKFTEYDPSPEGIAFIENQLMSGGQFLGDLYYSAYASAVGLQVSAPVIESKPVIEPPKDDSPAEK